MPVQKSKDEVLDVLQDDPRKAQALYYYWDQSEESVITEAGDG